MAKNYERMKGNPNRRNRPETLLRILMNTSYPHSTLASLVLGLNEHSNADNETLHNIADEITKIERSFDMTTFIRSVEILRNKEQVTVIVKQLDLDPEVRDIVDTQDTHVEVARCSFPLDAEDQQFTDLEKLSELILGIFRKTQPDSNRSGPRSWTLRQRPTSRGNAKLGNHDVPATEERIDHQTAAGIVAASLCKSRFHIVLTHNAILMFDQARSLK